MFSIELSKQAEKFLDKLDAIEREKILRKIYSIRENPTPHLKKLTASTYWRLRIDDYRAIIDLIIVRRMMFVVRIGHRKNIYDK